jgi:hypothetical protein
MFGLCGVAWSVVAFLLFRSPIMGTNAYGEIHAQSSHPASPQPATVQLGLGADGDCPDVRLEEEDAIDFTSPASSLHAPPPAHRRASTHSAEEAGSEEEEEVIILRGQDSMAVRDATLREIVTSSAFFGVVFTHVSHNYGRRRLGRNGAGCSSPSTFLLRFVGILLQGFMCSCPGCRSILTV